MTLQVVNLPDEGWNTNTEKEYEFTFSDDKECYGYFKQLIKDHFEALKKLNREECLDNNDDNCSNDRTSHLLTFSEIPGRTELIFDNRYTDKNGQPYYVAIKEDAEGVKKLVNNKVCFKFTDATIWFIINIGELNTEVIVERI